MICVSLPSEDSMAWRKSASESFVDSLDASFCESGGELGDCGALVFGLPVSGFCANAGAINSDKAIKPANSNFDFTGSPRKMYRRLSNLRRLGYLSDQLSSSGLVMKPSAGPLIF